MLRLQEELTIDFWATGLVQPFHKNMTGNSDSATAVWTQKKKTKTIDAAL